MLGRKSLLLVSLTCVGVLGFSALASADTITVHDLSQNAAAGIYTYTIQFDDAANVQSNDGFVIYDFSDLLSYSFSGAMATSQFSLTQTLTSNTLDQAGVVDLNGSVAALTNGLAFDNASVPNLSFGYVGSAPFLGAATGILTLTTSDHGAPTDSVVATVDHSGPTPSIPYSFADNAVFVPAFGAPPSAPLFPASIGGGVLFCLIGIGRFYRLRRFEA